MDKLIFVAEFNVDNLVFVKFCSLLNKAVRRSKAMSLDN